MTEPLLRLKGLKTYFKVGRRGFFQARLDTEGRRRRQL